jgi:2-alkyl-3-oxoalkanoate reductase
MTGDGTNTLSVVYASDCASAVVSATVAPGEQSGKAYFVDDGSVYVWRDALSAIEQALGKRAFLRIGMPLGVLKAAAAATQLWGKVTNTAQMLTLDKVNELTQPHWVCSGVGARRDLGWTPQVSWTDGVQKAVAWYRAEGWL